MSAPSLPRPDAPASPFFDRLKGEARAFAERWASYRPEPSRRSRARASEVMGALLVCALIAAVAIAFDAREPLLAERAAPMWRRVAEMVTRLGLSGYIFASAAAICLAALALRGRGRGKIVDAGLGLLAGRAAFVILVNAVSGIASQILKHLVGRARPELLAALGPFHFDLFSIKAKLASFPSGHSVTAFSTALALALFAPRLRIPLYSIAIAVGISRLILLAHYPSDILAGAALGLGTTWLLARAFARRRIVFTLRGGRLRPRGPRAVARALRGLVREGP